MCPGRAPDTAHSNTDRCAGYRSFMTSSVPRVLFTPQLPGSREDERKNSHGIDTVHLVG